MRSQIYSPAFSIWWPSESPYLVEARESIKQQITVNLQYTITGYLWAQ